MKTIIITGANGNLGSATVKHFLEHNYRVIAIDASNPDTGSAISEKNYEFRMVNLLDEQAAAATVRDVINKHGGVDGVLLLAGGFAMGTMCETDLGSVQKMFDLNFKTAYSIARPAFEHMIEKKYGRIVFVGARPALKPAEATNKLAYALSKAQLFKLAEIMNADAKGKNVVTSVIVPSVIDTPPNRESMPDADPSNWVRAEQIAETLEFICSDRAIAIREGVYKLYNNA